MLEALERLQPGLTEGLPPLLSGPAPTPPDTVVQLLVNQLAELTEHTVLVLDDYHTIASDEIHRSVAILLELMPPLFHW